MRFAPLALVALALACRYPNADQHFGLDEDGDGVPTEDDCDDTDPDVGDSITFHVDADGDGVGDANGATSEGCEPPDGFAAETGDCDDADDDRFPGNAEVADDGVDQDCNGDDTVTCFADADGDGWGSTDEVLAPDGSCDTADGEADDDDDCDDDDDTRFPGAEEIVGDGTDQNCDGFDTPPCYTDDDDDTFGDPLAAIQTNDCAAAGGVTVGTDCDDDDDTVYPGAPEICDGQPNPCGGSLPPIEVDGDGDDYVGCTIDPGGWDGDPAIEGGDDCNTSDGTIYPTAPEICDGKINTCGGSLPATEIDGDNDTFVDCGFAPGVTAGSWGNAETPAVTGGGDCDDADVRTFPGATEVCDGKVNACSGSLPANEIDNDDDTFVECTFASGVTGANWGNNANENPDVADDQDCDDAVARTFPGAPEFCDGFDNDCDTQNDDVDADSVGVISREASNGTWTDLTPANLSSRTDLSVTTNGTNWLCPGDHFVRFNIDTTTASVIGRYGRDVTTLSGRTPQGAPTDRMIYVDEDTAVITVQGLTLEGGYRSGFSGGAIRFDNGTSLDVLDCRFEDNFATNGGAIAFEEGVGSIEGTTFQTNDGDDIGGAIWMSGGTLALTDVIIDDNTADEGAAIYVVTGALALDDTTVTNNLATASGGTGVVSGGGAIRQNAGTLTITGGSFGTNEAEATSTSSNGTSQGQGGAIRLAGTTLSITGTTFSNNLAESLSTGGGNPVRTSTGGAIHLESGTMTIGTGTQFLDNRSTQSGGAIHVAAGAVAITGALFDGNVAQGGSSQGGGALSMVDGTVVITGTDFLGNRACASTSGTCTTGNDGGAILVMEDVDVGVETPIVDLSESELSGNVAFDWGGAIACHGPCDVDADNTIIDGNTATEGGGILLDHATASFTCTSTPANAGAVTANVATDATTGSTVAVGGGVQINTAGATVASTACDWGVSATPEHNSPNDIGFDDGTKNYAAAATFACTFTGCAP